MRRRRDAAHAVSCAKTQPSAATGRRRRAMPEPGPPSRAAHASARSMPCDAAGALAIRSGEQHGLNVIVVIGSAALDRSGRPMQAGSEIFRQRLPMREDLPLEGDGPAPGERGDGALDIAVIPGEQRDQRRSRLSHERRQDGRPAPFRAGKSAGPDTRCGNCSRDAESPATAAGCPATSPRSPSDRCRSWNSGTGGGSAARRPARSMSACRSASAWCWQPPLHQTSSET